MSAPLRFTTVRIGVVRVMVGGSSVESDVRVVLGSDGGYRLLAEGLSEAVPTLEEAAARAVPEACPPGVTCEVRWRADGAPLESGESPCPICGAPVFASPRYPRKLCPACVLEATDAEGRSIGFSNLDLSGGLVARYSNDGTEHVGSECLVRGVRCRAEEGKFGGVVVQPLPG